MNNLLIFGASGHGAVILDSIEKLGTYNVIGFVDSFKPKGDKINGYQILGTEADLPEIVEKFNINGGVVAIGDNWTRKNVVKRIHTFLPDFNFISVVHPEAIVGKDVTIGQGTVVMPGAVVNANSHVGEHCIINTNSSLGHDGRMEDFSSLSSGVVMGGNCYIGRFSAVSLGAMVIENITILKQTVIGAGSLVLSDIPAFAVAYGSPAKVIRHRSAGDKYLSGTVHKWANIAVAKPLI